MKFFTPLKISVTLGLFLIISSNILCQQTMRTYLSTSVLIPNPERGWYEDYYSFSNYLTGSYRPLDSTVLKASRENKQVTLILRLFYLHQFLNEASVSSDYIAKMQADFNSIRAAGVKCIIRFGYSDSQSAAIWDATPDKVMSHIESLKQVLIDNSDIIAAVQAGFIGAWGEWYYTKNFAHGSYTPNATDQLNRRLLVEALLAILPENIQVQVRTPSIKKNISQTIDPISDTEAYDGSIKSRIGHHNDCFLANSSDYGTYTKLSEDIPWLGQETKYAIAGGETCDASNLYSDCAKAIPRMKELHWTYLNSNYNQKVYDKWEVQNCINEANLGLGYRIFLDSAILPESGNSGSDILMTFSFKNVGFAAPTQHKPIQIVLINTVSSEQIILPFTGTNNDIRFWFPGDISVTGKVSLPLSLANGNYALSIRFPDQSARLESRPAYSIQLANIGLWNPITGYNSLNHILSLGTGGEGTLPIVPSSVVVTAFSDTQIDLSWSGNSTGSGVEIYRSIKETNEWEKITVLDGSVNIYSDKGLYAGTSYSYLIRAVNAYGYSQWTEKATASTIANGVKMINNGGFNVYPNPIRNGDLYIQTDFKSGLIISILDIAGKEVYASSSEMRIVHLNDIRLEPGVYLINVRSANQFLSRKLMVN
jgi:hypothetical protein